MLVVEVSQVCVHGKSEDWVSWCTFKSPESMYSKLLPKQNRKKYGDLLTRQPEFYNIVQALVCRHPQGVPLQDVYVFYNSP